MKSKGTGPHIGRRRGLEGLGAAWIGPAMQRDARDHRLDRRNFDVVIGLASPLPVFRRGIFGRRLGVKVGV